MFIKLAFIEIERSLIRLLSQEKYSALTLNCHPHIEHYLNEADKDYLISLCQKHQIQLDLVSKDTLHLNAFEFINSDGSVIEI